LEATARGEPESPAPWPTALGDDDAINAWIHARNRARPAAEVLGDAADSFARLRAAVATLPDEALTAGDYFPWLGGRGVGPVARRS
jgi:hypothetical protein